MNERIKKLAEKADLEALYIYESHPNFPKETFPVGFYTETRDRIFAELIVKECILEAMDAIHFNKSIRIQLNDHFGIKSV